MAYSAQNSSLLNTTLRSNIVDAKDEYAGSDLLWSLWWNSMSPKLVSSSLPEYSCMVLVRIMWGWLTMLYDEAFEISFLSEMMIWSMWYLLTLCTVKSYTPDDRILSVCQSTPSWCMLRKLYHDPPHASEKEKKKERKMRQRPREWSPRDVNRVKMSDIFFGLR